MRSTGLHIHLCIMTTFVLAGCGGSNSGPTQGTQTQTPPPGPVQVVNVGGLISDGPVIGGTVYAFTAQNVIAAMEAAQDASDRNAALNGAGPSTILGREKADGDSFELVVGAAFAGESLFLVFDNTGAEDEDFGDDPPNLEAVAIAGEVGSTQTVNISLHTTLIAQIVRSQLDPDGDGTPIDSAAVQSAIQAAEMTVLDLLGRDDDGEDLFDGESPIDTEDPDLLHGATSVLGLNIRTIAALEGLDLDEVLEALGADASDGQLDGAVGPDFDLELEDLAGSIDEFLRRDDDDDYATFAVGPCSTSAVSLRRACAVDVVDNLLEGRAFCADISDDADRADCLTELETEEEDTLDECDEVFDARLQVCAALQDMPHEPMFGPAFASNFVDPREIGGAVTPNPYLPLVPGTSWVYEGSFIDEGELITETVTVTVTDSIKMIDDVPCLVVTDVVLSDAGAMEDTDDWFAQDLDGNVWYCGEISRDFELFEGDDPEEFELVEIPGSWKHGRDGAKAGILVPAAPEIDALIRQEVLYGEAEDVIEIESITGTEAAPGGSCTGDCLVTLDYTPLEPGPEENKYYAPGIGMIVEVDLETGDRLELMEFTPPPP